MSVVQPHSAVNGRGLPLGPADARHGFVYGWLVVLIILVFIMVIVGGATRLTGSGLSITEWRPVTGAIPPLNDTDWLVEFQKYRESPQYLALNQGMSLGDFKFIFWWEWGHRQLGRFIGLVYVAGLVISIAFRFVSTRLGVALFGLGLLLGTQGIVGWIMVASGLQPGMIAVAPVKLTLHLCFACLFFLSLVFVATRISSGRQPVATSGAAYVLLALVFLQIGLGGLVAGSRAGFTLNTWPLLDGDFLPPLSKLFVVVPWFENFADNPTMVQFNHRMLAYGLLGAAIWHAVSLRSRTGRSPAFRRASAIAGLILVQAILGIITVLLVVPLWAGLAHQALAMVILAKASRHAAIAG